MGRTESYGVRVMSLQTAVSIFYNNVRTIVRLGDERQVKNKKQEGK